MAGQAAGECTCDGRLDRRRWMWRGVDGSVIGRATTTMSLFGDGRARRQVKPPRRGLA